MKLVSDRSAADIERERAESEAAYALQQLAANIMRVAAGAGEPVSLYPQLHACCVAMSRAISAEPDYSPRHWEAQALDCVGDEPHDEWESGMRIIQREMLRHAAAYLVGAPTQQSLARNRFMEGFAIIERIRETNRRRTAR